MKKPFLIRWISCLEMRYWFILAVSLAVQTTFMAAVPAQTSEPPAAPRELRGVWVATLDNIDWPSKKGLSTSEQQAEVIRILELLKHLKLNAVILQVRSAADAIYPTPLEPWSVSLTGQQGRGPSPAYDPLKFWINEAHARGIELHAWLNPCRAHIGKSPPASSHISRQHPELVKSYGKFLWLDPGEPEAMERTIAVLEDLLQRYDLDAVHIDDYFYPYPIQSGDRDLPFPDDTSWNRYLQTGGKLSRADWRRENVNQLVQRIHTTVRRMKPQIRFGISPFGIGRPGTAPGISGFDQYAGIFADPALWLRNSWCDYLSPQLYWSIDQKAQSFPVLLDYWKSEAPASTCVWPGLFTSRLDDEKRPYDAAEIVKQIRICRDRVQPPGHLHFSLRALQKNSQGIQETLKTSVYTEHALVPPFPSRQSTAPPAPSVRLNRTPEGSAIEFSPSTSEPPFVYALWTLQPGGWTFQTHPGVSREFRLSPATTAVVVSAVSRQGLEGKRERLEIP